MPRLHRAVVLELITEITSGRLVEGAVLPREVDLARRFDVSRGVAREAIRALEERGLVSVTHGRGAHVNPAIDWDLLDEDVLAAILRGPGSMEAIAGVIEALRIVAAEAVTLAARRATARDLLRLADSVLAMRAAVRDAHAGATAAEREWTDAERAFHRALFEATRNPSLRRMIEPLRRALSEALTASEPTALRRTLLAGYERISSAVSNGDARAARVAVLGQLDGLADLLRTRPASGEQRQAAARR